MRPGSKFWIGAAAGLTLAQTVASALLPRGFALAVISDMVSALLMLAAMLAFLRNAIPCKGRLRTFWLLQSACWFCWLANQCMWIGYDLVLGKPMPMMFTGDALLFLPGVFMLAGLLLRPHLLPSSTSVRLGILDFLQLMLWWVFFYVCLVMCWQYVSPNEFLYNRNYDGLYAIEVVVLLAAQVHLLRQSTGAWKQFYAFLIGAVLFNCLSFLAENRAIESNAYYSGSWYDTPYAASFAFFVIVAMKGSGLTPTPETGKDAKYGSWMAGLAMVAVLSLPIILTAVVMGKAAPPEVLRFRVIVTSLTIFTMAALVFVKQRRLHQELRQTNQTLAEASLTDPLTGIKNRRYFSETVEGDVAQTLRAYAAGRNVTARDLIFYLIDLDSFKEVNDLYGHDAGDRVLVETVRRIGTVVRDSDVLLRWGGEEFLVISRFADRLQADALAQRVIQAVRGEPFEVSSTRSIQRTCSIGWAAFPWLEENPGAVGYEEVLNLADRALAQAKRAGKDRAIGMTPPLDRPNAAVTQEFNADPAPAGDLHHLLPVD